MKPAVARIAGQMKLFYTTYQGYRTVEYISWRGELMT